MTFTSDSTVVSNDMHYYRNITLIFVKNFSGIFRFLNESMACNAFFTR